MCSIKRRRRKRGEAARGKAGGLSMARHMYACDRRVSVSIRELFREERAGVVCYWHVQFTLKLLGIHLKTARQFDRQQSCKVSRKGVMPIMT